MPQSYIVDAIVDFDWTLRKSHVRSFARRWVLLDIVVLKHLYRFGIRLLAFEEIQANSVSLCSLIWVLSYRCFSAIFGWFSWECCRYEKESKYRANLCCFLKCLLTILNFYHIKIVFLLNLWFLKLIFFLFKSKINFICFDVLILRSILFISS